MTETTTPGLRNLATIEHYVKFWNAEFSGDQSRLASLAFTDDVSYHAPIGVLHGTGSLIEFRNEFADNMGAIEFRLRAEPEALADRARLRWEILVGTGGVTSFAEGSDVVLFADDGRISSISTFLDRAPEGFELHDDHHGRRGREGRW
jgi:hypothetical protein